MRRCQCKGHCGRQHSGYGDRRCARFEGEAPYGWRNPKERAGKGRVTLELVSVPGAVLLVCDVCAPLIRGMKAAGT